jgi:hypothetical protein
MLYTLKYSHTCNVTKLIFNETFMLEELMTENFNGRVLGTQKCFSPSLAASP